MVRFGMVLKAREENVQDPLVCARIQFDVQGTKDFIDEVAAEEAPVWVIELGVNVLLVATDNTMSEPCGKAVGEDCAILD